MALIGIILQAAAGFVYGVSYLIGVKRIDEWSKSKKDWLANDRNRVKVSYSLTFLAPLALVIYTYKLEGDNIQWYYLILGFIFSWAFIVGVYASFLSIWSRSKSIADLINNPRGDQMIRKSNIASIVIGVILMTLGWIGVGRLGGVVIGNNISSTIVPIILIILTLIALCIGFVLVLMPMAYYICVLFVKGVSMLFRPGKAVWILALSLYLAGCALLIINEIHTAG
jgi:hypothetical protein